MSEELEELGYIKANKYNIINDVISAEDAKKKTEEQRIYLAQKNIVDGIEEQSNLGKNVFVYFGQIPEEIINVLEGKGYKLSKGEGHVFIRWD